MRRKTDLAQRPPKQEKPAEPVKPVEGDDGQKEKDDEAKSTRARTE